MKTVFIGKPYISECEQDKVRLNCDISTNDDNKILNGTLYYETSAEYKKYLCTDRVDAFVLGLLSSAMLQNYSIYSELPMSERVKYQLNTYYIPTVSKNFKDMNNIYIDVPVDENMYDNEGAVVTGNSGGVDSFYSILKYSDCEYRSNRLTHIIYNSVCCEDFDQERIRRDYNREIVSKAKIADELDLKFIGMFTNLFQFYPFPNYVFNYFFTTSYVSCIYALQGLFSKFYFSSGIKVEDFSMDENKIADAAYFDWFTVDCVSSESLKVYSAGAEVGRLEKTKFILENSVVQKYLQVDSIDDNGTNKMNCGKCSKCLRTLSTIYALGQLDNYREIFDTTFFEKNKQRAFAKMLAGDHSKAITSEILNLWKTKSLIRIQFYFWYVGYASFYFVKHSLAKNKTLKTLYYKSGLAKKVHELNGEHSTVDDYYEKYGKINIR